MSVLVKGMEKPEHCGYCRFRYDGICHALQKTQYSMDECPLSELIRCKDCANWDTEWTPSSGDGSHYCPMIDLETNESFYCASSERKDNG